MHRINLRGPWLLEQISDISGQSVISLKRSFNSPTNIADEGVCVKLKLSFVREPLKVDLNGCSFSLTDVTEPNAVSICGYDVKSSLLPHNQLTVQWQDHISGINSQSVHLRTERTDRWLEDAWLEIIEP